MGAARQLFSERGYFATRVEEIAELARVAPATVYAVSGGKQGLLRTLIEIGFTAPVVAATIREVQELEDPLAILSRVAATCRGMREDFGDIMRVMLNTAPHDPNVAESLATATSRYRQAFLPIAQRLAALDALHPGMDAAEAVDLLWFYFGYSGLFTLHDENGWRFCRAEKWLCREASRALLKNPGSGLPSPRHRPGATRADLVGPRSNGVYLTQHCAAAYSAERTNSRYEPRASSEHRVMRAVMDSAECPS